MKRRFFVLHLTDRDYRPTETAHFEIQVLDTKGRASVSFFIDESGNVVVEPERLSEGSDEVDTQPPREVIAAALRQPSGQGDYVNEYGQSIPPF